MPYNEVFSLNNLLTAGVVVSAIGYGIHTAWNGYISHKKTVYDKLEKLDKKIDEEIENLERKRKEDCADRRKTIEGHMERMEQDIRDCKREVRK